MVQGWVPGCLLKGWQLAWTIMPDSFRPGHAERAAWAVLDVMSYYVMCACKVRTDNSNFSQSVAGLPAPPCCVQDATQTVLASD